MPSDPTIARLLIRCPDQPGIVGTTAGFLHTHGANITSLDQHASDFEGGTFFMRLEFHTPHVDLPATGLVKAFDDFVAKRFEMEYRITYGGDRKKAVLFASSADHALLELLWRAERQQLDCEIACVISNHDKLRKAVEGFDVPFHYVANHRGRRRAAEEQMLALCAGADLLVLARYMQILSGDFVARFPNRIINIHHSFLPAFVGADPYRQAWERGVKIVGATAHYVTADLDQGPIIAQGVADISHRQNVEAMKRLGQSVERDTLANAVQWHLEDRVVVDGTKTVVFR